MHPSIRLKRLLLTVPLFLGLFVDAHAYTSVCVKDSDQLLAALSVAPFQSQTYRIDIEQGSYSIATDIDIEAATPITIRGGFAKNTGCGTRVVDAANTVVHFRSGGVSHGFGITQTAGSPEALIAMDGISLDGLSGVSLIAGKVNNFDNDEGSVLLRNVRLSATRGLANNGLALWATNNRIDLQNTVLANWTSGANDQSYCAIKLWLRGAELYANHASIDVASSRYVCLVNPNTDTQAFIYNSIIWGSDGGQPKLRIDPFDNQFTTVHLINTIFPDIVFNPAAGQFLISNAINTDPGWIDPAGGDYHLQTAPISPAINSGSLIVPGGEPAIDAGGYTRIVGSAPDRGAYESPVNNLDTIWVKNTLDSGAGSLRDAIEQANSTPDISKTIKFDIRDAGSQPLCPATIQPGSNLPSINSSVVIDGYSQPGSIENSSSKAFNAKLCVILKPAAGTLPVGLRVASNARSDASLSMRGIGIGGFDQPLLILGGADHVITGNQFGGVANGISLPAAALNAISFGVNAGGAIQIGGPDDAERNVIVGAQWSGINIQQGVQSDPQHCQILNNLIGLGPDGSSPAGNLTGIYLSGDGCLVSRNRIAANSSNNILVNGSGHLIQRNAIGITANGTGVLNSAWGIRVNGGSDNTIGSGTSSSGLGNSIAYNVAGGVLVDGDSAVRNSVCGNIISNNGLNGDADDIDLRASGVPYGPDDNDAGDGDEGANRLQNYPLPQSLAYAGAGSSNVPATLTATLDTKPGSYLVQAYFSSTRNPATLRGHAEVLLKTTTVVVGAQPTSFDIALEVPFQSPDAVISLTATDAEGNTSELSPGLSVQVVAPAADSIFSDGFDP